MMLRCFSAGVLPGGAPVTDEKAFRESVRIARQAGYDAIEVPMEVVVEMGAARAGEVLDEAGLLPAVWQVHDAWRLKEDVYLEYLGRLPALAHAAVTLGGPIGFLWMPLYSDERDYEENFAWHAERIRPVAEALKEQGIKLAIEWQGTPSLMRGHKYEFIHDLAGTLDLIGAIGVDNVGILLDTWHWWLGGDTVADLDRLFPGDVLYVHIADAPAGIPKEEQADLVRAVPGQTGIIDLVGCLKRLKELGFTGPVEPSTPGCAALSGMSLEDAARTNREALDGLFQAAGIG